jgi:phytanoyl-CoA hydroxylase
MKITAAQLSQYERDGFLVLERFVSERSCDDLRKRAEKLVNEFDAHGAFSIFSTKQQNQLRDQYFLESGDKIRFFFEEDAFLPDGSLKKSKDRSINKIGHALHDLDPVFPASREQWNRGSWWGNLVSRRRCFYSRCTSSSNRR